MDRKIYQKLFFHLSVFGVVVSVLVGFYDVIFGSVFEFFHLMFEVVEIGLDRLIEMIFHTNPRQTELIVFYILLCVSGVLIYFTWKASVQLCGGLCDTLKRDWVELKTTITEDWQAMSITHQLIWVGVFLLVNYLASFLLF
jgi:hypothetical protein